MLEGSLVRDPAVDVFLFQVPEGTWDFYISASGFLCAGKPRIITLSEFPVGNLEIMGWATPEQKVRIRAEASAPVLLLRRRPG